MKNKEEWEGFLLQCKEKTFLQSWNWGDFNLATGGKIWRFGIYNKREQTAINKAQPPIKEQLLGVALVVKTIAKRGTFLFIPHGPVIIEGLKVNEIKENLELILNNLKSISIKENSVFIRVAPILERTKENINIFTDLNFKEAPIHIHPEITWELDITLPEEKLLMNMRKTTRYLIRQAEKNPNIKIIKSSNINDLELFKPVYAETARRHNFTAFANNYLEKELEAFLPDNQTMIFLGKYKNKVVAVAIFVLWQDVCFYHHSGSLSEFNKIPVSYLLQWEAIKEAKKRGYKIYNFCGIAPEIKNESDAQKSKHPWAGLSLFKMGFGGYKKKYLKTQDFIISRKYWFNYIIETARKIKRGL